MNLYTQRQLEEMIMIERTWALNNPSGPLPDIPQPKYAYIDNQLRIKSSPIKYAPYKDPHWIIRILMKLRIL